MVARLAGTRGRSAHAARVARERLRLQLVTSGRDPDGVRAEIHALTEQIQAAGEQEPVTALARRLGADRRSEDFLSFVIACCTDPACATALAKLQGTSSQYGVTTASYAAVSTVLDDARELSLALAADHPLTRAGILEARSEASVTPAMCLWAASARVSKHLLGDDTLEVPLSRVTVPELALFDEAQEQTVRQLVRFLDAPHPIVLALEGPSGAGRATAVAVAAEQLGRAIAVLSLSELDRSVAALERGLLALRRETALTGAVAVLRGFEALDGPEHSAQRRLVEQFLQTIQASAVVTTSIPGIALQTSAELIRITWTIPAAAARRNMWSVLLAHADPEHEVSEIELDDLGHRYTIAPGTMQRAIASAVVAHERAPLTVPMVVATLRQHTAERLTGLTAHVQVRHTWEDLVLAPDTRDQIDALIARVRHSHQVLERWGLEKRIGSASGIAALFSGPPGTGKTMVAGLVARELGLDLHQVDLSQVMSKWIGETEKQLAQIFDAASSGHCLLLFDEADALFTKRTEVKSSNDRYSNLEVNFLLQRLESFRGIVILTTNLDASMDPAFKRRLAAHVVFWPPDEEERARLWRHYLSSGVPLAGDLDLDRLVHTFPDLSGAHIRNAVLNAAFSAASKGGILDQSALEIAARNEYAAMGRVLSREARVR